MQTRSGNQTAQQSGSPDGEGALYLCRTKGEKPVNVIERAHQDILHLCRLLERIADSLPAQVDQKICHEVSSRLLPFIIDVHRYEETIMFPWLERHYPERVILHESLRRLRYEHVEDEDAAAEICEVLSHLNKSTRLNTEAAGYMFRGFFEGMRRHVACEKEYLYDLLEVI